MWHIIFSIFFYFIIIFLCGGIYLCAKILIKGYIHWIIKQREKEHGKIITSFSAVSIGFIIALLLPDLSNFLMKLIGYFQEFTEGMPKYIYFIFITSLVVILIFVEYIDQIGKSNN